MIGAIIYIVVIVYVLAMVRKKKNAAKTQNRKITTSPVKTTSAKEMPSVEPAAPKAASRKTASKESQTLNRAEFEEVPLRGRKKAIAVSKMMEDRNHDWLAMQLADERRALRKCSEMFDLKMSHHYSCEAEALKRFHEDHCEAEMVDNPTK